MSSSANPAKWHTTSCHLCWPAAIFHAMANPKLSSFTSPCTSCSETECDPSVFTIDPGMLCMVRAKMHQWSWKLVSWLNSPLHCIYGFAYGLLSQWSHQSVQATRPNRQRRLAQIMSVTKCIPLYVTYMYMKCLVLVPHGKSFKMTHTAAWVWI